jgi:Zn-dependent protease
VSDSSHWWPGNPEGSSGPQGTGARGRSGSEGDPYRDGSYYYPPGVTPGARRPNQTRSTPPRPTASSRHLAWGVLAFVVALVLLTTHRITRDEVILFCVIMPSIMLHEVSHGFVALLFGDDTAKRAGRLTLNPIAHVDIVGTIIVPVLMILGGYGLFGWAKPVPVNVSKLRSPRNHGVLVSLAGPATNAVLCALAALAFHLFGGATAVGTDGQPALWSLILFYLGLVNVWLTLFNLIPIPPLDGSVVIERLLPGSWWPTYLNLRRYTLPLVLIVVVFASIIPDGNTTLIGHLYRSTITWWESVLGVR